MRAVTRHLSAADRLSPLYQRFNGVMFGFFAQMATFEAARDQWPDLRLRMQHFCAEIGLQEDLPADADEFVKTRNQIFHAVLALGEEASELQLAFGLGYSFVGLTTDTEVMARSHLDGGMSSLHLDPTLLDELVAKVSRDERGRPHFDELMTEGLNLAAAVIEPCAREARTCFVAMPFREPYPAYCHEVYRVLLESHGLRCLRAWGGMRNEKHHDLLVALIDRCGYVFAELTDANPNVTYELGFGTGRGLRSLAVMDENPAAWKDWREPGKPRKLSNLMGVAVMPYDSSQPDWRREFLDDLGPRYVSVAKEIYSKKDPEDRPSGFWSRLLGR